MALTSYNRWQAFAVHFAISLGIFLVLLAVVFGYWYPGVLREADQSWQRVLMLIVGVDLVLGPLLTLVVFNPTKKSLKMDLSIIAMVQIGALVAGLYTVHQSRPIGLYLSFPPAGFELITADNASPAVLRTVAESDSHIFYYGGNRPLGVGLEEATAEDLVATPNQGFDEFMQNHNGIDLKQQQHYHIPLALRPSMLLVTTVDGAFLRYQWATKSNKDEASKTGN